MWDFKIAFDVPRGYQIVVDTEPQKIDIGEHQFTLRALKGYGEVLPGKPELRHGGRMLLTGSGYPSEVAANQVVVRVALALLMAALRNGFGISFTSEAWCQYHLAALTSEFKRQAPSSLVLLDTLGAEVFKSKSWTHEFSAVADPRSLPIDGWLKDLQDIYDAKSDHSTIALPLIILNEALGERSITSRLLLSVTAIEAIAGKRKKRSKQERDLIDVLISQVESSTLDAEQKKSLKSAISNAKKNSISKTCRDLIRNELGEEYVKKFKELYDIRSKLVHEGVKYPIEKLHEQANEALEIATKLIRVDGKVGH